MLSVVGDVPVDSGVPVVTSSISRSCRLNILEVPIGVGLRVCIHRDEGACVFVSVCICTVFLKKNPKSVIFLILSIGKIVMAHALIH